jgi:hypothetical protein
MEQEGFAFSAAEKTRRGEKVGSLTLARAHAYGQPKWGA